jgi:prepilin-type N-terminal cleavage/methylation domain-containing protein
MMLVSSQSAHAVACQRQRGVTLIELLIVITIMMGMLSLVAPVAFNAIEKAEAQDEYLALCGWLRSSSIRAFANGSGIQVRLDGNMLTFSSASRDSVTHTFKYLTFPEQSFTLNRNGMPDQDAIDLVQREKQKKLDLRLLLEGDGA